MNALYGVDRRLRLLESQAEMKQAERRKHEPFFSVEPWSIMRDTAIVQFYPEGLYTRPVVSENLSFSAVMEWVQEAEKDIPLCVYLDSCTEWLMLRTQNDPGYTERQKKESMERWMQEIPEMSLLYTDPGWAEVRTVLETLPSEILFGRW